jgi:hypothetical protein
MSMLITDTFGRLNLGVHAEHERRHSAAAATIERLRINILLGRAATWQHGEMIPTIVLMVLMLSTGAAAFADPPILLPAAPTACLSSGDGYFRARVAGAIEARIDWPNSGTRCEGESKDKPAGVRLSFQRASGGAKNLLFVFGITGVREGQSLREAGTNLTVIIQGTSRIFGTLGDKRCTVDSLTQRALKSPRAYRVEARGFCTQPAHAVRGDGEVLVSTFEFAGLVNYDPPKD